MDEQRDVPVRPLEREIRALRIPAIGSQRAADPRPARRSVGRRERHGAHLGDCHRLIARLARAFTIAAALAAAAAPVSLRAADSGDAARVLALGEVFYNQMVQ